MGTGWYRPDWSPDGKSLICNGQVDRDQVMVKLSPDDPGMPPVALPAGKRHGTSPCYAGEASAWVFVDERPRAGNADPPHSFDGRYDITTIDLTVVYLVPKDRRALVDWRERVDYFTRRIAAFHHRESGGRSTLRYPCSSRSAGRFTDRGKSAATTPTRPLITRSMRRDRLSIGRENGMDFPSCSS